MSKLGIKASKRTVQKYMRAARPHPPGGSAGPRFCETTRATSGLAILVSLRLVLPPIFMFVFIELATRNVVFAATTPMQSQAWVAQPLRNATPLGVAPKFLIPDRDDKFGTALDALALATGLRVIHTAVRGPNMNAICKRFLGSLRSECLDHILVLDDRHLHHRVVAEYIRYFNAARPHQGLRRQTPVPAVRPSDGKVVRFPVLGGLHLDYIADATPPHSAFAPGPGTFLKNKFTTEKRVLPRIANNPTPLENILRSAGPISR